MSHSEQPASRSSLAPETRHSCDRRGPEGWRVCHPTDRALWALRPLHRALSDAAEGSLRPTRRSLPSRSRRDSGRSSSTISGRKESHSMSGSLS